MLSIKKLPLLFIFSSWNCFNYNCSYNFLPKATKLAVLILAMFSFLPKASWLLCLICFYPNPHGWFTYFCRNVNIKYLFVFCVLEIDILTIAIQKHQSSRFLYLLCFPFLTQGSWFVYLFLQESHTCNGAVTITSCLGGNPGTNSRTGTGSTVEISAEIGVWTWSVLNLPENMTYSKLSSVKVSIAKFSKISTAFLEKSLN